MGARVRCSWCFRNKPINIKKLKSGQAEALVKKKGMRDIWVTGRSIKGLLARLFENHCLSSYHLETYKGAQWLAEAKENKR